MPSLAAKVGEVLFSETASHDFTGNFYRVWVKINVHRPLKNAVSLIRDSKWQIYKVKYERLPDWCAVCGHLGHVFKEHGNGIHPKSALVFKDLRASWSMRRGRGPGGDRGCRGGRRGSRFGGNRGASREDPGDYDSYREDGDGQYPGMDDMTVEDMSRKRADRGDLDKANMMEEKQTGDPKATELAIVPAGSGLVSPPPNRDPKCSKIEVDERDKLSIPVKSLAGSFKERHRAQ